MPINWPLRRIGWRGRLIGLAMLAGGVWWWMDWKGHDHLIRPFVKAEGETADDPAGEFDLDVRNAPDFAFAFGDGSGWHGYDVVRIKADGTCSYTFRDNSNRSMKWMQATFVVDGKTMAELRKLVEDVAYFRMKRAYYNTQVRDGTQRWAWVRAQGREKHVSCSNYFPRPFMRLHEFVQKRIVQPNRAGAVASAVEVKLTTGDTEKGGLGF